MTASVQYIHRRSSEKTSPYELMYVKINGDESQIAGILHQRSPSAAASFKLI